MSHGPDTQRRPRETAAIERMRVLPQHRRADPDALAVLEGAVGPRGVGTPMHAHHGQGESLHEWFVDDDEARARFEAASDRRSLLGFEKHDSLANQDFVRGPGLDPDEAAWRAIGFDWARPRDPEARRKLFGMRFAATR